MEYMKKDSGKTGDVVDSPEDGKVLVNGKRKRDFRTGAGRLRRAAEFPIPTACRRNAILYREITGKNQRIPEISEL